MRSLEERLDDLEQKFDYLLGKYHESGVTKRELIGRSSIGEYLVEIWMRDNVPILRWKHRNGDKWQEQGL